MRTARSRTVRGCKVGAWAENVTDVGSVAWQVSLPAEAA